MEKDNYQLAIDRYKFGYLSPALLYKSKKYCTHAIHRKPEKVSLTLGITLTGIILISVIILIFGCVEQFIVFFGMFAFSTIVSSILFKR